MAPYVKRKITMYKLSKTTSLVEKANGLFKFNCKIGYNTSRFNANQSMLMICI
jgi:hypothetical protein